MRREQIQIKLTDREGRRRRRAHDTNDAHKHSQTARHLNVLVFVVNWAAAAAATAAETARVNWPNKRTHSIKSCNNSSPKWASESIYERKRAAIKQPEFNEGKWQKEQLQQTRAGASSLEKWWCTEESALEENDDEALQQTVMVVMKVTIKERMKTDARCQDDTLSVVVVVVVVVVEWYR